MSEFWLSFGFRLKGRSGQMRRITAQDSIELGNWVSEHSDALRDNFLKGMSLAEIAVIGA
jgi:hypothetical protein